MPRRLAALASAALGALALSPAVAGAAGWSAPSVLAAASTPEAISVGMDARGNALAAWLEATEQGPIVSRLSVFAAGVGWSAPVTYTSQLSPYQAPAIAVTPLGVTTVAYVDPAGEIEAATGTLASVFKSVQTLGGGSASPLLATDDQGDAVVVWRDGETLLAALRTRGAGTFSSPQVVATGVADPQLALAMNPAGTAALAFVENGLTVELAYLPAGAVAFDPPVASGIIGIIASLQAGVDLAGDAVVGGASIVPFGDGSAGAFVAVRSALGGLAEPFTVGVDGILDRILSEPDGQLAFLTEAPSSAGANDRQALFATRAADGTLAGPTPIAPTGTCFPAIASDPSGDMLAAWTSACAGPVYEPGAMGSVAARFAGGAFGPSLAVAAPGAGFPLTPALDAAGQGLLVYSRSTGGGNANIEAVGIGEEAPAPLPPSVAVHLPATLTPASDGILRVAYTCTGACSTRERTLLHVGGSTTTVAGVIVRHPTLAHSLASASTAGGHRARHPAPKPSPFVRLRLSSAQRAAVAGARTTTSRAWLSISLTVHGHARATFTATRSASLS